jgi:retinol dehydrogenase-14
VEAGAKTPVYLASSQEVEGVTGKFFIRKQTVESVKASYDKAAQKRLWDISQALTGLA